MNKRILGALFFLLAGVGLVMFATLTTELDSVFSKAFVSLMGMCYVAMGSMSFIATKDDSEISKLKKELRKKEIELWSERIERKGEGERLNRQIKAIGEKVKPEILDPDCPWEQPAKSDLAELNREAAKDESEEPFVPPPPLVSGLRKLRYADYIEFSNYAELKRFEKMGEITDKEARTFNADDAMKELLEAADIAMRNFPDPDETKQPNDRRG